MQIGEYKLMNGLRTRQKSSLSDRTVNQKKMNDGGKLIFRLNKLIINKRIKVIKVISI